MSQEEWLYEMERDNQGDLTKMFLWLSVVALLALIWWATITK